MASPETRFDDTENNTREVDQLKREYIAWVGQSSLGLKERAMCLQYVQSGKNYEGKPFTADGLRTDIKGMKKFEEVQAQAVKEYGVKILKFAAKGLFSKDPLRQKAYLDWFRDLPYQDSTAPIDKKRALEKSDLDRPERAEVAKKWRKLPSAVREKHGRKYEYENGLEENQKMVDELLKQHETLKARFLKLPKKVQETYRKLFKNMDDLDERGEFLDLLDAERKRLTGAYTSKIRDLQKPDAHGLNLFSDAPESESGSSAGEYLKWFETKLNLDQMEHLLAHSDLDKPERVQYRDHMAKILGSLPADKQKAVRDEFNAADLTGRKNLVARYGGTEKTAGAQKGSAAETREFATQAVRRELFQHRPEKLRQVFETYAILEETATRRKRAEIRHHAYTVEGLKKAAGDHHDDTKEARKDTQKLDEAAEHLRPNDENQEHDLVLRRRELREKHDIRYQLMHNLRMGIDDRDAQLIDVHFRNETGTEMQTDEFRHTQIGDLKDEIFEMVAPVVDMQSRRKGLRMDKKQLAENVHKADLKAISRGYIRQHAA